MVVPTQSSWAAGNSVLAFQPPPSPSESTRCDWSWKGVMQWQTVPGSPPPDPPPAPLTGLIFQLPLGTTIHQTHLSSHHRLVHFPFQGPQPAQKAGSGFHIPTSPMMAGRLLPTGHTGPLWSGHKPTRSGTDPARDSLGWETWLQITAPPFTMWNHWQALSMLHCWMSVYASKSRAW